MKIKIGAKQQHKITHIETQFSVTKKFQLSERFQCIADNFSETLAAGRQIKVGRFIRGRLIEVDDCIRPAFTYVAYKGDCTPWEKRRKNCRKRNHRCASVLQEIMAIP